MIHYLTRNELNIEKYNHCISRALNSRVYAFSWYLDIVTDNNWDILVLNDYEAVMPLPKRRKYLINYIFQPSWVQQLGVFSPEAINGSLIEKFIRHIPKKFKFIDVLFNSENYFQHKNLVQRINYTLSLNKPYESIFKNYKKGRKSSVKKAMSFNLILKDNYNQDEIIKLFKINKGVELNKSNNEYTILNSLIKKALSLEVVACLGVQNNKEELIGGAFFLKNNNRITYLFSSINDEGREKQVMSYLIDSVIKKYSDSEYIFDFEGSMLKDLASFFKSFGAEEEPYYHLKLKRIFN